MRSELFGDVAGLPPHPAAADENIGVNEPDHIGDPKLASNSCGMATVSARIPAARIPRPNRRQRSPSHCGDAGKLGVPADCATVHSTFWGGIEGRERARARGKCPLPHLWERHEVKRGGGSGGDTPRCCGPTPFRLRCCSPPFQLTVTEDGKNEYDVVDVALTASETHYLLVPNVAASAVKPVRKVTRKKGDGAADAQKVRGVRPHDRPVHLSFVRHRCR